MPPSDHQIVTEDAPQKCRLPAASQSPRHEAGHQRAENPHQDAAFSALPPKPPPNRGMQTVFAGHYAARMSRAWHITRPGNPDCPFFLRSRNAPWTQCSSKTWTFLIISSRILSHCISNANLNRVFQHHLPPKPGSRHKPYLCSINMNLPSIWEFHGGNILWYVRDAVAAEVLLSNLFSHWQPCAASWIFCMCIIKLAPFPASFIKISVSQWWCIG